MLALPWRFLDLSEIEPLHLSAGRRDSLGRVSVRDDFRRSGNAVAMDSNGWRNLAARLVEVDLAIENLESWATRPEDIAELERLEGLRMQLQAALASKHLSRDLRRQLEDEARHPAPTALDPRD